MLSHTATLGTPVRTRSGTPRGRPQRRSDDGDVAGDRHVAAMRRVNFRMSTLVERPGNPRDHEEHIAKDGSRSCSDIARSDDRHYPGAGHDQGHDFLRRHTFSQDHGREDRP